MQLVLVLEEQGIKIEDDSRPLIYIGSMGETGFTKAQQIAYNLRKKGLYVEYDIVRRSVKAQLKYADRINAKYVVIIGDNEIETDKVNLKDMDKSEQREINLSNLEREILN